LTPSTLTATTPPIRGWRLWSRGVAGRNPRSRPSSCCRSEGEDLADLESALACLQVSPRGARWRGECGGERVFCCPRAACQIGRGGRALHRRTRGARGRRAGPGPVHCANCIPLWRGDDAEARSASRAGHRRARWCSGELRIHRPLQEVACAHFVVRRLERRYGKSAVRAGYERFCCESEAAA